MYGWQRKQQMKVWKQTNKGKSLMMGNYNLLHSIIK